MLLKHAYSHRTSWAVRRFFGSLTSIFLTKSFALSDIEGHGSDTKSRSPFKTCSNIPCSVSDQNKMQHIRKLYLMVRFLEQQNETTKIEKQKTMKISPSQNGGTPLSKM